MFPQPGSRESINADESNILEIIVCFSQDSFSNLHLQSDPKKRPIRNVRKRKK